MKRKPFRALFSSVAPLATMCTLLLFANHPSFAGRNGSADGSTYDKSNYRMAFVELAKEEIGSGYYLNVTPEMVDDKISAMYQQLFFGTNSQKIMFDATGTPSGLKFIKDIGSGDIRSEGMSYGMMIAVMMDDKQTFDALWGFVRQYMWAPTGTHYSWSLQDQAGYPVSTVAGAGWDYGAGPAPDAEEYFAMALFFADHRWGSGTGTNLNNYNYWANNTLGVLRNNGLWNGSQNMAEFSPGEGFTDPSYHLPAFYQLWGLWADSNNTAWTNAASTSRTFFTNAVDSNTGLFPEYSNYNGSALGTNTATYNELKNASAFDAYRVIQNMAVDHYWWSKNDGMENLVDGVMDFYNTYNDSNVTPVGGFDYGAVYRLGPGTGTREITTSPNPNSFPPNANPWATRATAPVPGLAAMNAVGALASNASYGVKYVHYLWNLDTPTGNGRYYDGLLMMLADLHLAGYYRIYEANEGADLDLSMHTGRFTDTNDPIIHWDDTTYFTVASCPIGQTPTSTPWTWTMTFARDGQPDGNGGTYNYPAETGTLTPLSNGRQLGEISPLRPSHYEYTLTVTRYCSGGTLTQSVDGYVDPSGFVKTTLGYPIDGAKVVLFQTETDDINSNLVQLPQGSTEMAEYNRNNPDYTDSQGHFGWDVKKDHWYQVVASHPGCVDPDDPSKFEVATDLMHVLPEVTDLDIRLYCPLQRLQVNVAIRPDSWPTGYCADVYITNMDSVAVDWVAEFKTEGEIYTFWDADYSQNGNSVTAQGLAANNVLEAGASTTIGFCANRVVTGSYPIRVHARGTTGQEIINLTVGGIVVATWQLSTSFQDYTVNTSLGGGINVVYINDGGTRDVIVDYLAINNVIHQAEDQTEGDAAWGNGYCGGGHFTEWMHCNGYLGFSAFK